MILREEFKYNKNFENKFKVMFVLKDVFRDFCLFFMMNIK